jgi:hypothetical protein
MAIITFSQSLGIGKFIWGQQRRDAVFSSSFGSQAVGISGPLWLVQMAQSNVKESDSGAWQALALKLSGKVHQLELWNLNRPEPLGTLRGTLVLSGAHAQGATSLVVSGGAGQAGATVKTGDYFGVGSGVTQQVVMALADATANGSGVINLDISATPLRNAFADASAVAWDKPKALFRQAASRQQWEYGRGNMVSGISLDLVEDWRAA